MASPRRTIAVVAVTAVIAAGGGYAAAQFIVSPADAAARTAPPAAGPITVPVVLKALHSEVTTRGDVAFTDPADITIPAGGETQPVVTGRVPKAGDPVTEGMVLLEVAGRPVIALGGALATYRTLVPGSRGPDVLQLQHALHRLRLLSGRITGVYDAATIAAVVRLYAKLGYAAPTPGPEAQSAVDQAKEMKRAAEQQVAQAESELAQVGKPPTESERLSAQDAIDTANAELEKARTAPTAPDEATVAAAQRALDAANQAKQDADQEVSAAEQQLQQAQQAAQQAADKAAQDKAAQDKAAQDKTAQDTAAPGSSTPKKPAATDGTTETEAAVTAAQQQLDAANSALASAKDKATSAQQSFDAANQQGPPDQTAIDAAENKVAIAVAQRDELLAGPDTAAARKTVTTAKQALAQANSDLTKAVTAAGTPLPAAEVVSLAGLPRRVNEVKVKKGSAVDGTVMTVSGSQLQVSATVSENEASLLKKGMAAVLTLPGTEPVKATITSVKAADPDTDAGKNGDWTVTLDPGRITKAQTDSLGGANVKVVIAVGATAGKVLAVPTAALYSDADGNPRVEVLTPDGSTRFQTVKVGLTAAGEVEVVPTDRNGAVIGTGKDTLAENSLVVVGR